MSLGSQLLTARRRKDLSQQVLATMLGVSTQQYHRYESDKVPMKSDTLVEACRILGCSADWLLEIDTSERVVEPVSDEYKWLRNSFMHALNTEGQHKIIEYARDVAMLPHYRMDCNPNIYAGRPPLSKDESPEK